VDSVLRKLFSGDFDFRKTETNLFLYFVRPQKGVWGMNAGGLLFRRGGNSEKQNFYCTSSILLFFVPDLKESILGIRLGHFR